MNTPSKPEEHTIDATDQSVGRLASQIAVLLRGKNTPQFEPHMDCGGAVVVKNIQFMKFTGKKTEQKVYHRYTGYPSGIRTEQAKHLMEDNPAKVLRTAVRNMLPDVKFRTNMMKRLTIE